MRIIFKDVKGVERELKIEEVEKAWSLLELHKLREWNNPDHAAVIAELEERIMNM